MYKNRYPSKHSYFTNLLTIQGITKKMIFLPVYKIFQEKKSEYLIHLTLSFLPYNNEKKFFLTILIVLSTILSYLYRSSYMMIERSHPSINFVQKLESSFLNSGNYLHYTFADIFNTG